MSADANKMNRVRDRVLQFSLTGVPLISVSSAAFAYWWRTALELRDDDEIGGLAWFATLGVALAIGSIALNNRRGTRKSGGRNAADPYDTRWRGWKWVVALSACVAVAVFIAHWSREWQNLSYRRGALPLGTMTVTQVWVISTASCLGSYRSGDQPKNVANDSTQSTRRLRPERWEWWL